MKVCVIGGGTGSSAVLRGLVKYPDVDISVIVSMADDGGSNAVIRDQFGLLPLSDLRKSIISLSQLQDSHMLRKLLTYRFSKGDGLEGHTLGNLMMMALSDFAGDEIHAIKYLSQLFQVKGQVIPATLDDGRLVAEYDDGSTMFGEHYIDEPEINESATVVKCWMEPEVTLNPTAVQAIEDADYIIVGPGDLYGTILATVLAEGFSEAVDSADAKLVYVTSLMSKLGQTRGLGQLKIKEILEQYIGSKFDFTIVSDSKIPQKALDFYHEAGEHELADDLPESNNVLHLDLLAKEVFKRQKGDSLVRSMVRHDPGALAWELYKLMKDAS